MFFLLIKRAIVKFVAQKSTRCKYLRISIGNSADPAANMGTETTSYRSPKRKRDALEPEDHSPPASPTSTISITSFPEARLREEEELGRYSPRTAVAGRLRDLAIQEASTNADVPYSISIAHCSSSELAADHAAISGKIEKPQIQMTTNGTSVRVDEQNIQNSPGPTTGHARHLSDQSSRNTKKIANAISRNKSKGVSPTKSRRKKSPPPSDNAITNSLTWSDSEITGHNPVDPSDDGYGINGIGFKPTAAAAWARSQKRQKQVTEWKNREAKEARERRRERREGVSQTNEIGGTSQKKVKFDLG